MKWQQFLQDSHNIFSMTRLIAIGAFIISSGVLIYKPTEANFAIYCTMWVANFLGSKFMEYKYAIPNDINK